MTVVDVIRAVLVEPLTATELAVRMVEAGYQTTMGKKALRDAVGVVVRGGGFTNHVGKSSSAPVR
jgi:hypothetical protein